MANAPSPGKVFFHLGGGIPRQTLQRFAKKAEVYDLVEQEFGKDSDEARQWFLKRIRGTIYYEVLPECSVPDCDTCRGNQMGINIQDIEHARMLHEWSEENKAKFLDEKPNYG